MAPKGAASQSSSSRTANTPTLDTSAAEVIAAQQAEIDCLIALLQDVYNAQVQPAEQTVTTLVESIVQSIERLRVPTRNSAKSIKIPDLDELSNGVEPTFCYGSELMIPMPSYDSPLPSCTAEDLVLTRVMARTHDTDALL